MFNREHHQKIAEVLERLDAQVLKEHSCYFGGGTAIALMNGEYRESVDIDFLVSRIDSFRALRYLLSGPQGITPITRNGMELVLARDIRADQYAIRTMIRVDKTNIKFEIISEGRISFEVPKYKDRVGNIVTLSRVDLVASKLLANADRWNDEGVFSRDLIDLAMMKVNQKEFQLAMKKAQVAYGDSAIHALFKASNRLLSEESPLDRCLSVMKISVPKALIWQNIEDLRGIANKFSKANSIGSTQ